MKLKVLGVLKPKVASFGFSKESVDSFATQIAENIKEDATDEEVNAQVEAVIPFFKISQSEITRVVNLSKEKKDVPPTENPPKDPVVEKEEPEDKLDKLFKLISAQNEKIESLSNKEISKSRREIYSAKIKDLPETVRLNMMKKFDRISFKDGSDFETFLEEEEVDIPKLIKEHSEAKLDEMGKPIRGGHTKTEATDEEVQGIINNLNI